MTGDFEFLRQMEQAGLNAGRFAAPPQLQWVADLSDEGLGIMSKNLDIITEEFEKATGKSSDTASVSEVYLWIHENKPLLREKLHPRTAFLIQELECLPNSNNSKTPSPSGLIQLLGLIATHIRFFITSLKRFKNSSKSPTT